MTHPPESAYLFRGPVMPQQNALADVKMTPTGSGGEFMNADPLLAELPQSGRAFSHASGEPERDMLGRPVRLVQVGGCW